MVKRILLVDDDEDDREFFLTALHDVRPAIVSAVATNGAEALKMLMSESDTPDLIFLDLNMPLMNGEQFLRERQRNEKLKKIPVIILTTSSDAKTKYEMGQLGVTAFATKPDKHSLWKSALSSLLDDVQENRDELLRE